MEVEAGFWLLFTQIFSFVGAEVTALKTHWFYKKILKNSKCIEIVKHYLILLLTVACLILVFVMSISKIVKSI